MSDFDDGALWHEIDRLREDLRHLAESVRDLERRLAESEARR